MGDNCAKSCNGAEPSTASLSYVEGITTDIQNVNNYAKASLLGDRETMIRCFNAITWADKKVKEHIQKYCEADHAERALVDEYYGVLCPHHDKVQGPSFNTMSLWLKARLHMQHLRSPLRKCSSLGE